MIVQVGGQAVLGRQNILPTPWLTERHGYDPTWDIRGHIGPDGKVSEYQVVLKVAFELKG